MYICSDTVKGEAMGTFQVLPSKVVRDDDFQTVMEAWERDYLVSEQGLSPNTVSAYTSDMRDYVSFLESLGLTKFSQATREDVTAWVAALTMRHLSPSTFRARICALRDLYKYLSAYNIVSGDVLPYIEVPRRRASRERPLKRDQELAVWATYDDNTPSHLRDRAEFALMDDLGLRESEVAGLDLEDVRPADGDIWVHGKGDKPRLLPLAKDTTAILREYIDKGRPRLKCSKREQDEHALFLNTFGERITRQAIWQQVAKHGREAGIEHLHPHQLRRTFATEMYRNDMDLRSLQEMLGHADLETTSSYITPDEADIHARFDEAEAGFWEEQAKKSDRMAAKSSDVEDRRYWESLADYDRRRSDYEKGDTSPSTESPAA